MNRHSRNEEKESLLSKHIKNYNSYVPNLVEESDKGLDRDLEGSEVLEENVEAQDSRTSSSWPGYLLCILSGICFIAW